MTTAPRPLAGPYLIVLGLPGMASGWRRISAAAGSLLPHCLHHRPHPGVSVRRWPIGEGDVPGPREIFFLWQRRGGEKGRMLERSAPPERDPGGDVTDRDPSALRPAK